MDMNEIVRRLRDRVRNHVAAKVPSQDIDDVVQVSLLRITKNAALFQAREGAALETWAGKITAGAVVDYYRDRKRRSVTVSENFSFTPDPDGEGETTTPETSRFGEDEAPEDEPVPIAPEYTRPTPSSAWLPRAALGYDDDEEEGPVAIEAVAPADDEPEALAIAAETEARVAPVLLRMLDPEEPGLEEKAREQRLTRRRAAVRKALNSPSPYVGGWTRHGMRQEAAWNRGPSPSDLFAALERLITVDHRVPHALVKAYARNPAEVAKAFGFHPGAGALRRTVLQAVRLIKVQREAA